MNIKKAIAKVERLLPGKLTSEGDCDPRWQGIITIAEFIHTHPVEVWRFIRRWGSSPNKDVRSAVATCLLEHLFEHHFDMVFPLVRKACTQSKRFVDTFLMCWEFGQTKLPKNRRRFRTLKKQLRECGNKAKIVITKDKQIIAKQL